MTKLEKKLLRLLKKNLAAWEDEEGSVQDEHQHLIRETARAIHLAEEPPKPYVVVACVMDSEMEYHTLIVHASNPIQAQKAAVMPLFEATYGKKVALARLNQVRASNSDGIAYQVKHVIGIIDGKFHEFMR